MTHPYPLVSLSEVLTQYTDYVDVPEDRIYPKLSVKLYGKGVTLDTPANGSLLKMQRHQIAQSGQVILSEIWGKKGAIGFVPPEGEGALCTSHFFLFDVCCDKVLPEYLQAIFTANYLQDHLDEGAKGTTGYAAVRPQHLLAAKIPLPPLTEQRRLVARIEALAAKIEEARELRRKATIELSTLLKSAVDTVLECSEQTSILSDLLCEDTLNGLGRCPSDIPPGTPILRISAATSRSDAVVNEDDFKYLDVNEKDKDKYTLKEGDLLACRYNGNLHYVGRFAIFRGHRNTSIIYPDKLIRFRVNTRKVSPEFVCIAANASQARKQIMSFCATTAGNIGISAGNLKSVRIPVPSLAEQDRIVAYLDGLQAKVDALKQLQTDTAAELDALLPAVLDRAFRGLL